MYSMYAHQRGEAGDDHACGDETTTTTTSSSSSSSSSSKQRKPVPPNTHHQPCGTAPPSTPSRCTVDRHKPCCAWWRHNKLLQNALVRDGGGRRFLPNHTPLPYTHSHYRNTCWSTSSYKWPCSLGYSILTASSPPVSLPVHPHAAPY